ncbi:hypothetical protein AB1K56_11830 [Microbacterium sp. BWR-S6Y]|uniref:DUF7255 family protein n=1 Tax=Microbacterium sp. BWR-S6Y TaxID=3232073 RepID=UPI003528C8C8
MAAYRQLGGVLSSPILRPSGWDIQTASGLIVELDEEQHFNRHRAETLRAEWAVDLPWQVDYLRYCADFERVALKSHSGAGFWTSAGSARQFGPAGSRRDLEGAGSPRWKQRAIYDAMRDSLAASGKVSLARLSVHDRLGSIRLGDALRGLAPLDLQELRELLLARTTNSVYTPASSASIPPRAGSVGNTDSAPPEPASTASATFRPTELAKRLGYHDESRPGRVVRAYLRERYPDHPKKARWLLNEEQAQDVLENVPPHR